MRAWLVSLGRLGAALRTAWLVLGVVLIWLLLVEGAARVVLHVKRDRDRAAIAASSGFRGADWAPDYVDELLGDVGISWEPYVYWRSAPLDGRYIHIGPDGLRRTKPAAEDNPQALRVWMFGGSTVWGWGARDDHTIPANLAAALAAQGRPAVVTNFGQIGYVSTQDALALEMELRTGRRPDAVVFLNGYNDLMSAVQESRAGIPQNEANRRRELNAGLTEALKLEALDSATVWLVRGLLRRLGAEQDARSHFDGDGRPKLAELGADVARIYAANIAWVEAARHRAGFEALYYWQPTAFDKRQLVGEEQAAASAWPVLKELLGHVRGQLAANDALRATARFADLTAMFDDVRDAVYLDSCHFSEPGNAVVAERIARDLGARLAAPETPSP
ncbi:MAG: SGNH/GDSL hydrolase family protein [Pirellulales bacterium]|nr:SGNH/GDSL hydrolase family protein [Pirellulales bacterium]